MNIMMKLRTVIFLLSLLSMLAGTALAQDENQNQIADYQPVTTEELENPDDADWPMYRRTYNTWGHSPLDQITRENVDDLRLVWSRVMEPVSNESTPIVRDGIMFLANANDVIQAIDATDGTLIWEYRRELPPFEELEVHARFKRSVALYEDKLFFGSADNSIVALDAATGQVVWETSRGPGDEASIPTGPIVANGVVVAGSSCSATDNPCYITGHDVESGEELWRNYPLPLAPGDLGDDTWGDMPYESRWKAGVWHAIMYDPEADLIHYGSNSVGPASPTARGTGDASLFGTNTRFAVRPRTGEVVWSHQIHPLSSWDQECTLEMILLDGPVNPNTEASGMMAVNPNLSDGEERQMIVGVPCKTGTVFAFDRNDGEFLWAKQTYEFQNLYESIDPETGEVTPNPDAILTEIGQTYRLCPSFSGGRLYQPTAYSPDTNTLFIPGNNLCGDYVPYSDELTPEIGYGTESTYVEAPGANGQIGRLDAVNLETGETLWTYEREAPRYSPVATTGGGLVFGGNLDRWFEAIDQETGEVLWNVRLPGQITGHTVSYEVDGRQYVATVTGSSLSGNGILNAVSPEVDAPAEYSVFVFALPEDHAGVSDASGAADTDSETGGETSDGEANSE